MKSISYRETVRAVEALSAVLKQTKGQLKPKERGALVDAVLKTVATGRRTTRKKSSEEK
jgi:hypothetical protein